MFNYGDDGDPHEDEQFYNKTVYNEDYYIERDQELIRESNLELELERLENESIREMREEGLLRPISVKPDGNIPEIKEPEPANPSNDAGDLPSAIPRRILHGKESPAKNRSEIILVD
jgi:hypothetical protein